MIPTITYIKRVTILVPKSDATPADPSPPLIGKNAVLKEYKIANTKRNLENLNKSESDFSFYFCAKIKRTSCKRRNDI